MLRLYWNLLCAFWFISARERLDFSRLTCEKHVFYLMNIYLFSLTTASAIMYWRLRLGMAMVRVGVVVGRVELQPTKIQPALPRIVKILISIRERQPS